MRSAYRTLLGRSADPDGEELFTGQLRAGVAKTQIILALRSSPEARRFPLDLPGLRKRLFLARLFRLPLLAQLARLTDGEYSRSRRARARRRLENDVARLNHDNEFTRSRILEVSAKVERMLARLNAVEFARPGSAGGGKAVLTVEQILDLAK